MRCSAPRRPPGASGRRAMAGPQRACACNNFQRVAQPAPARALHSDPCAQPSAPHSTAGHTAAYAAGAAGHVARVARTLHGDDVHALHAVQRRQARVDGAVPQLAVRLAGHHDRARAAAALAAAQLGPGEALLCTPGERVSGGQRGTSPDTAAHSARAVAALTTDKPSFRCCSAR